MENGQGTFLFISSSRVLLLDGDDWSCDSKCTWKLYLRVLSTYEYSRIGRGTTTIIITVTVTVFIAKPTMVSLRILTENKSRHFQGDN